MLTAGIVEENGNRSSQVDGELVGAFGYEITQSKIRGILATFRKVGFLVQWPNSTYMWSAFYN